MELSRVEGQLGHRKRKRRNWRTLWRAGLEKVDVDVTEVRVRE